MSNDDGTLELEVEIEKLDSHHGTDAKRRSAAKIRTHLLNGGYLHMSEWMSEELMTALPPSPVWHCR